MSREQNFQNIAWFRDLYTRELLEMDPPYQRNSVWNRRYREDFIDTVLLGYPSPAIFLFESFDEAENAHYAVVDGKQRLTTVLSFVENEFPVGQSSPLENLRGLTYENMSSEKKKEILRYRFSVEYLPSDNETEINNIFDRLNRNVKKLTAQELRHARFDGVFIAATESLAEWLVDQFPSAHFPRIAEMSRRQMKDAEIVATLLLYLEEGAKSYSTATLDIAFSDRDETWENAATYQEQFQQVIRYLSDIVEQRPEIAGSRLRNQADFYSLFAAVADLRASGQLPEPEVAAGRLNSFLELCESDQQPRRVLEYLDAARSASNDAGPRKVRISVVKDVLLESDLGTANGAP